jgi:flagellar protein FliO/FliZ
MASGPSSLELLVRLAFSLALIVGLLLIGAKVARRHSGGLSRLGLPGLGRARDTLITVVERHSLSRTASLAVVHVAGRLMVVAITDQRVSLLSDAPLAPDTTRPSVIDLDAVDGARIFEVPAEPALIPSGEAGRTLPPGPDPATDVADGWSLPPRMSFVEALREMTVRKL